jgi:hypothetical protein
MVIKKNSFSVQQSLEERKSVSTNVSSTIKKGRVSIGSLSQSLLNIDVSVSKIV